MIWLWVLNEVHTSLLRQGPPILSFLVYALPLQSHSLPQFQISAPGRWFPNISLFLASVLYPKSLYYTPTWIAHQQFPVNVLNQTTLFLLSSNFDLIPGFSASADVLSSSSQLSRLISSFQEPQNTFHKTLDAMAFTGCMWKELYV